jgi:hypothetical protein
MEKVWPVAMTHPVQMTVLALIVGDLKAIFSLVQVHKV